MPNSKLGPLPLSVFRCRENSLAKAQKSYKTWKESCSLSSSPDSALHTVQTQSSHTIHLHTK